MDGGEIRQWQQLVRDVIVADHVRDYLVRCTMATHAGGEFAPEIATRYLRWGSSPRGAQTLALAAKVRALLDNRYNVSFEDVRQTYLPAMRHRVVLNFEAQAEGIDPDAVLQQILEQVPEKAERAALAV
jgi:MoxR-like ATPase